MFVLYVIHAVLLPFITLLKKNHFENANLVALRHQTACRAVSVITHYFLSSSFCWMLVEGINVYNKIVRVFSTKKYDQYYYVLGWGKLCQLLSPKISLSIMKKF